FDESGDYRFVRHDGFSLDGLYCSKRDWDAGNVHRVQAVVVNDPKVLINAAGSNGRCNTI
ncbi:MAG TPA: hypothetical protein VFI95_00275, partial [Terriglobales bacterium]|nr:hypothetical protein [Terriglobales bacterium]